MKVCEVCGALQATTDTDKRLIMHLEGKLHTGYQKIRKVLSELKIKRDEYRKIKDRDRRDGKRRSRSRSPIKGGNKKQERGEKETKSNDIVDPFYFSSRKLGSGVNLPSDKDIEIRYSDIAVGMNNNVMISVPLANSTTLGKEWGYYKRNIDNRRKE